MNQTPISILLLLIAVFVLAIFGCGNDDDPPSSEDFGATGEDDDDDNNIGDDDDDDDDDNDDNDDNDTVEVPKFVRPELPINAYHMAATHNTFIWSGPAGGPTTLVSSLGLIRALNLGQLFLELDVTESDGNGDFLIDHSGATQSVRLSSVLRNIRWWSDTHPGHEMIVIGFQWGAGTSAQTVEELNDLLAEFLVDASSVTATGPLYSLTDWLAETTASLDQPNRDAIAALNPTDIAKVAGYPAIETMRQKVVLETTGGLWDKVPAFFLLGGSGQFVNIPEGSLGDIAAHTDIRMAQRLTRVYTSGRAWPTNYNLYDGFANGVSNSALNMAYVTTAKKEAFAFMDEEATGYAPPGYVQTVGGFPTRLGPPVFVGAFPAEDPGTVTLEVSFDEALGIVNPPAIFCRVIVTGLFGGEIDSIASNHPNAVVLRESTGSTAMLLFALPAGELSAEIEIQLAGDFTGYEFHLTGPTVSAVAISDVPAGSAPSIWISPTFDPVEMEMTGACTTLGSKGVRLFGDFDGELCDASANPSFHVEMIYSPKN
jgi:hypothetical protein